jgi:predicted secreted protein
MADEKGTAFLLKVGDIAVGAATFASLEGQTTGNFDGSTNVANTTAKDNAGWQTGVSTTINGTATISGILRSTRTELDKLEAAWVGRTTHDCELVFDAAGNGYTGDFYVTQFNITGDTEDVDRYTITMTPAAALTAIP